MPLAKYKNQADVPEALKAYFVLRNGEYVFDHEQFDGLEQLVAGGLRSNRDDWQTQAMTAKEALKAFDGVKPDQIKTLSSYAELGDAKTVKARLAEGETATKELAQLKRREALRAAAAACGTSPDALIYGMESANVPHGVYAKEVQVEGADKKPVNVKQLYVKGQKPGATAGTFVEFDTPLKDFAAESQMPAFLVDQMLAPQNANQGNQGQQSANTGLKLPVIKGSSDTGNGGGSTSAKHGVDVSGMIAGFQRDRGYAAPVTAEAEKK